MTPDLAIVIVTHNSQAVITTLLTGLTSALDGLLAEVVVVDNDSTDETVDLVRARGVRVVEAPNDGYAAGINRGVENLPPDLPVLVLNPDCALEPSSVRILLGRLDDPGVGIVAPRMLEADGSLSTSIRRRPTVLRSLGLARTGHPRLSEMVLEPSAYEEPHEIAWATGAALLISAPCRRAVGPWDESFFLYSEETAYCLAAADHGFRVVFEPAAAVCHVGSASGWNPDLYAMQILNRVRLHGMREGEVRGWAMYAAALAREARLGLAGDAQARRAFRALLQRRSRPAQVGLGQRVRPWRNPGHVTADA